MEIRPAEFAVIRPKCPDPSFFFPKCLCKLYFVLAVDFLSAQLISNTSDCSTMTNRCAGCNDNQRSTRRQAAPDLGRQVHWMKSRMGGVITALDPPLPWQEPHQTAE